MNKISDNLNKLPLKGVLYVQSVISFSERSTSSKEIDTKIVNTTLVR